MLAVWPEQRHLFGGIEKIGDLALSSALGATRARSASCSYKYFDVICELAISTLT